MIGIIDYGMGNLHSVANALNFLDLEHCISADPKELAACDKLILPGVGSMADCMKNLKESGLYDFIIEQKENKKPILGICLGMQALFEHSDENGGVDCFGFLQGDVVRMDDENIRIPHIGWNSLEFAQEHPLQKTLSVKPYVYFDHSYYASNMDPADLIAYANYGKHILPGLVGKENVLGAQFHPEKSAQDGLNILAYFGKEFV
jgi:glutamine amidotransferase